MVLRSCSSTEKSKDINDRDYHHTALSTVRLQSHETYYLFQGHDNWQLRLISSWHNREKERLNRRKYTEE
jgi:hypothetical protein